ncbi:MAG: hypothetical protein SPI30_08980 [Prevotella sp.]|nr:hypothetical protein [Prevotella sp.]
MRLSKQEADDKSKSIELRKIATFKVDELDYMAMKTKELMPDSAVSVLDYQAYAMYDFINLFSNKLSKADKPKDRANIILMFKNASLNNPRFNDTDTELIMSYVGDERYITQFSLDTDWVKAIAEVRKKIRGK